MRKPVFALILGLLCATLSTPARAGSPAVGLDGVRSWNESAFTAVRALRAGDADAARWYAMLNVAMYDAVNGVVGGHGEPARGSALIAGPGPRDADPFAAAVAAAHAVLVAVDPARSATYDAQRDADLGRVVSRHRRAVGARWGGDVGRRVVEARTGDGSSPVRSQPA